jgi:hypothetical protein
MAVAVERSITAFIRGIPDPGEHDLNARICPMPSGN